MMTFKQFQESRKQHDTKSCESILMIDMDHNTHGCYIYKSTCYIEIVAPDEQYVLTIYNSGWACDDLERLEKILYFSFYIYECEEFTFNRLQSVIHDFKSTFEFDDTVGFSEWLIANRYKIHRDLFNVGCRLLEHLQEFLSGERRDELKIVSPDDFITEFKTQEQLDGYVIAWMDYHVSKTGWTTFSLDEWLCEYNDILSKSIISQGFEILAGYENWMMNQ